MRKRFYLPAPVNQVITCCGEQYFFYKIRHWKLAVMMGCDWQSSVATQRGLSYFSLAVAKRKSDIAITDKLNGLGIKYKEQMSLGGWQYQIFISQRKDNLRLIDDLYNEFFYEMARRVFTENHLWRHGNEFINDEERDFIQNELGCSVDYYTEVTRLEDITENYII